MANRIDNVLDKIETALKTLVQADGSGVLRSVVRRPINVADETVVPVAGLTIAGMPIRRAGGPGATAIWHVVADLRVCTRATQAECDANVAELMAEIVAVIDTLVATGTAGAAIDMPGFTVVGGFGPTPAAIGAYAELRIRIQGNLKVV